MSGHDAHHFPGRLLAVDTQLKVRFSACRTALVELGNVDPI